MKFLSGHEAVALEGEEWERQKRDWLGYTDGLVRFSPGGWVFPTAFTKHADKYYNFEFRPTDVLVHTWAKCGTTWTQEIVWTMRNNPDLNNPMADITVNARAPFLEFDMFEVHGGSALSGFRETFQRFCPGKDPDDGMFLQMTDCTKDPRTIKTHLPMSLLPPSLLDVAKVVAVLRNPKDVIVSYHHHCRLLNTHGYVGALEDFVQYFVEDDLVYSPYWLHVKEVWEKRAHPNLHIMFFEDMKANIMAELRKLDSFLGTQLDDRQLDNVARHTGFGAMKTRAGENRAPDHVNAEVLAKDGGFFRKGQSGDWKNKLSPEMEEKVNQYIEKKIKTIGIPFKFS
ncbi:sulfotransferase 1C4-like [Penaeus japonicus]|uniref:sulfotransferase 1C4-like n=1 Tax=Penaeus japonicus TaxID=27405 RepID=UPI001C70C858|nr:sulfotransferase 1C4-like [Penaeus japonicus]XP_042891559.1 sulfotransferase 1C4-like [Penaeus japonicus]XP_042891560.1 sulfotransferase 1C4-like [Penaeus japonicus]